MKIKFHTLFALMASFGSFAQGIISPGYDICGYVNNKGEVYMAGQNKDFGYFNTLGTGDLTSTNLTTAKKVSFPAGVKIEEISTGMGYFQVARSCEGKVYAWGINGSGEIGAPIFNTFLQETPNVILAGETGGITDTLKNVVSIATGQQQVYALLANGRLVSWGRNTFGTLGHGNYTDTYLPKYVRFDNNTILENVISVKCFSKITIALVDEDHDGLGTVYIWGDINVYNLQNRNTNLNYAKPLLDGLGNQVKDIKEIAINFRNGVLLDKDNNVLTWGEPASSGQNPSTPSFSIATPAKVKGGETRESYLKAKSIATSEENSYAITFDNKLVVWGNASDGYSALGTVITNPTSSYALTPDLCKNFCNGNINQCNKNTWRNKIRRICH
jgi:alpha-tubulin suppressor-like RCC1 family protein